jgi:hypothetical protein
MSSILVAGSVWAQSTGIISGTVTDRDGAAVPMTPVQATNTASKATFKATASQKGEYSIGSLPAGTYDVSALLSAFAFRPFVKPGVVLRAGETLRLDIRLEDGITLNTLGEDREAIVLMFKRLAPPTGPVPYLPNGKPDLSGFWMAATLPDDPSTSNAKLQALPWAEALAKQRVANEFKDIPSARCLPNGITVAIGASGFVHTPTRLVMLFEGDHPRQVYLDGRGHPKDLNPTWLGHSVGTWDGDTLVVDTVGFNDKTWLDMEAHPHTEKLHVIERFRRKDLGHMESEVTVEDPGALAKPWVRKQGWALDPKDGIQEALCNENERDAPHIRGR